MPVRDRNGIWHYRFWVDGREYTASTDLAATERNRTAAMRKEAKARELVLKGRAHELKLQVKPFNEAAAEFLDWADGEHREHPNTARRLRTSFASLSAFFGHQPVSAILRGHVNDFKSWRRKEHGVRDISIRHDLHALSKAYGYFIDHNWARENPVSGVEIPSDKEAVRIHVLTSEEEAVYFNAARKRFPALYDVGRIMLNQGCRPEEVLALRTEDLDMERSKLTIRAGKSDAAKRTLLMTSETAAILGARVSERERQVQMFDAIMPMTRERWLFQGKRPGSRLAKLNGQHAKLLEELAVCKCGHGQNQHGKEKCICECRAFQEVSRLAFVPYDFRHTFATRAAEAGMPIATLAAILGHADLRSITKYVHVRQDAQDRAMREFEISSGFRPVGITEKRDFEGESGKVKEAVSGSKIN